MVYQYAIVNSGKQFERRDTPPSHSAADREGFEGKPSPAARLLSSNHRQRREIAPDSSLLDSNGLPF